MVFGSSVETATGARTSQTSTVPSIVPTVRKRALCPGISFEPVAASPIDIGVREGDEVTEAPLKLSNGSSEVVKVANVEASSAEADIWTLFSPSSENSEVRHSSVIPSVGWRLSISVDGAV